MGKIKLTGMLSILILCFSVSSFSAASQFQENNALGDTQSLYLNINPTHPRQDADMVFIIELI